MIKLKTLLLKEIHPSPILTKIVDGYRIDIHLENDRFYSTINHIRYGNRLLKTPEKALEYAITKILPVRKQVDGSSKERLSGSELQAQVASDYFKNISQRGF